MVRGVRPITDIPAELTMMMANRRLAPDVETLFMIADGELAHVSSSLIKQIAPLASGEELAGFLPRFPDQADRPAGQRRGACRVPASQRDGSRAGADERRAAGPEVIAR